MMSEFRNGWRVALGGFLGIAIGVSSLYFYSLGIFLKPLASEFGWSRGEASLGPLLGTGCAALISIPVGRLADRIGSRNLAIGSLVLLSVSFAVLGVATVGLTSFLVITMLMSFLTAGSSPLPFTRLVVGAFTKARGMALGLILSGTGVGSILIPSLLPRFIADHGWRSGYLLLAAVIALILPVLAILLRDSPQSPEVRGSTKSVFDVVLTSRFGRLGVIFALASIAVLGTVVHFVPMLTDIGLSPVKAGGLAALIGIAAVGGRLFMGWLLDRVRAESVVASLFLAAAAGMLLLAFGGIAFIPAGAVIVGLSVGAEVDLISYLVARDFDRADYGVAYGALYTVFLVGGSLGPAIAGAMFDAFEGYHEWLLLAALLLSGAAAASVRRLPAHTIGTRSGPTQH